MAELTIRLLVDPVTGKKNVVIGYSSDSDALPMEHEDSHRQLVDRLIEGGALKKAELGEIIIERESSETATEDEGEEEAAAQPVSLREDG